MNTQLFPRPKFLEGTFSWAHLGYSYAKPPPLDLLSTAALSADSPWIVVAAVLERAKRGDHDHIPLLAKWCDSDCRQGFEVAAIELVGSAGRRSDLALLQSVMERGADLAAAYSADAASMSGCWDLIPSMLEAWKRVSGRNDHDMIGNAISRLLELPGGEIAAEAGSYLPAGQFQTTRPPISTFEREVHRRFEEVSERFNSDEVLWEGEAVNMTALAEQMLAAVSSRNALMPGLFMLMRQKFEVATGTDCSTWYRKGNLQPLSAAVVLEAFVKGRQGTRYPNGTRHFFGHPIPAAHNWRT